MSESLLVSVRLHEGWYHGNGQTPSPARLFQALVAGCGLSGPLDEQTTSTLKWLECQQPPIVAAPSTTRGQSVTNFVPNNDLDAKQGDPRRIGEIRTKKVIHPLLFDPEIPFLFAWTLQTDNDVSSARHVCELADRVYQFGRTVDMAWAWGEILQEDEFQDRVGGYPGIIRRPTAGNGDVECPNSGSLESLHRRYVAASTQFNSTADQKGQTFRRRPKPKWRRISYNGQPTRILLELNKSDESGFFQWPIERVVDLVSGVRDVAAQKLNAALPDRANDIDRTLIGRQQNGANAGPTSARIRIIPLPSIGQVHADMQIRRILLEVPSECPLRSDDVSWAFSGLSLPIPGTNSACDITRTTNADMLKYYGIDERASCVWRSVTPVALPDATRRRIEPTRQQAEAKSAVERVQECQKATAAVLTALRHSGVVNDVVSVHVQREPFEHNGSRVEDFSSGTRFNKHSLWHVELQFETPQAGPLVIGNGRFLGLGLMKPVPKFDGVFAFHIDSGLTDNPDPVQLCRALRRAVMARVQEQLGSQRLPPLFSGHHPDGTPARAETDPHLSFLFDSQASRLMVVVPDKFARSNSQRIRLEDLALLERSLVGLRVLRAGKAGDLRLSPVAVDALHDSLFASASLWESLTPYCVNRHSRHTTASAALERDVVSECARRGLPHPQVEVIDWNAVPGIGLEGRLRLKFQVNIDGPLALGRSRHFGGGLFAASTSLEKSAMASAD